MPARSTIDVREVLTATCDGAEDNSTLDALHRQWARLVDGPFTPHTEALRPALYAPWRGQACVVDVIADGLDFRYRQFGAVLAHRLGADLTGARLSDRPLPEADVLITTYRWAVVIGRAVRSQYVLRDHRGGDAELRDRLLLPFFGAARTVTQVLSLTFWRPMREQDRHLPAA
jgi:hypothetical protein